MSQQQVGLFTGLSKMLQAFFRAGTKAASATEKLMSSADHLAGYMEDTAATFADQARIERLQRQAIFEHNLKIKQRQIETATDIIEIPVNQD